MADIGLWIECPVALSVYYIELRRITLPIIWDVMQVDRATAGTIKRVGCVCVGGVCGGGCGCGCGCIVSVIASAG